MNQEKQEKQEKQENQTNKCECTDNSEGIFWCPRHKINKTQHWKKLCQTKPAYFEAWEKGIGPGQNKVWDPSQKSRGLGDTVAKITSAIGIKPCGGCKERQDKLNKLIPYKNKAEMKSPQNQWCIQIEITNFCPNSCSNCTRHCPHIKTPYFMTLDCFEKAVKSMEGYEGMLGIQGGEPTLHPQFEEIITLYNELWTPEKAVLNVGREPIIDFGDYHSKVLADSNHRRGLWSALGRGYYKHFELIHEIFPYQCLNDHQNPAIHTPLLITRKELGIKDRDWVKFRNNCWVQHKWSSSITPKGAFPCEIMASLDMLYNGPGGWDIEPGWWKREFKDFGRMLDYCEMCSACIPLKTREARENIQDISEIHLEKLKEVQSPAIEKGNYQIYNPKKFIHDNTIRSSDFYMPLEYKNRRISKNNKSIKPKYLEGVMVCVDLGEQLKQTLHKNVDYFDSLVIVTTSDDTKTQEIVKQTGATLVISDSCYNNGDSFNKGNMINSGLEQMELKDWVLFIDADIILPENFRNKLFDLILNPGCLYYTRRLHILDKKDYKDCPALRLIDFSKPLDNFQPWGYFQLWNVNARSLKEFMKTKYPSCFCSAGNVDTWFQYRYPKDKKIPLCKTGDFDVVHIPHGDLSSRWNGNRNNTGWTYVGQCNFNNVLPQINQYKNGYIRIVDINTCELIIISIEDFFKQQTITMFSRLFKNTTGLYEYQYKEKLTEQELLNVWNNTPE